MTKRYHITLLAIAFLGLTGQSAFAAPKATPKNFRGTYIASGFTMTSPKAKLPGPKAKFVIRNYQGNVKFSANGKISGRIKRTETTNTGTSSKKKTSRVKVSGEISKVEKSVNDGQQVFEATTKIKFSDGTTGTLTILNSYIIKRDAMSGVGPIKVGKLKGIISLKKM